MGYVSLDNWIQVKVSQFHLEQGTAIPGHQGQNLEIRVLLRSAIDCVVIVRMCTGDASAHVH